MSRLDTIVGLLLCHTALVVSGCAAAIESDASVPQEQKQLGEKRVFLDCNPEQQARLERHLNMIEPVVHSKEFRARLFAAHYVPCLGSRQDPVFPGVDGLPDEKIDSAPSTRLGLSRALSAVRATLPVGLICAELESYGRTYNNRGFHESVRWGGVGFEIDLSRHDELCQSPDCQTLGSTILHEISHRRGFSHGTSFDDPETPFSEERRKANVERCGDGHGGKNAYELSLPNVLDVVYNRLFFEAQHCYGMSDVVQCVGEVFPRDGLRTRPEPSSAALDE